MSARRIQKISTFGSIWDAANPARVHEQFGNSWFAWIVWAIVLEEAEVALSERGAYKKLKGGRIVMSMMFCVRAMLLGYAIECLLKALWVRQGNDLVRNGKYRGVNGASDHNLVSLSRAVGFTPTAGENDVLGRLSNFIRFAGRYPVAKTPDEMRPDELTSSDVGYFAPRDFRVAESLFNKLMSQVTGKKRRAFPRRLLRRR